MKNQGLSDMGTEKLLELSTHRSTTVFFLINIFVLTLIDVFNSKKKKFENKDFAPIPQG